MTKGSIEVTIEWKTRADGFKPKETQFSNEEIKERCPKLLVDFYESRINSRSKSSAAN